MHSGERFQLPAINGRGILKTCAKGDNSCTYSRACRALLEIRRSVIRALRCGWSSTPSCRFSFSCRRRKARAREPESRLVSLSLSLSLSLCLFDCIINKRCTQPGHCLNDRCASYDSPLWSDKFNQNGAIIATISMHALLSIAIATKKRYHNATNAMTTLRNLSLRSRCPRDFSVIRVQSRDPDPWDPRDFDTGQEFSGL